MMGPIKTNYLMSAFLLIIPLFNAAHASTLVTDPSRIVFVGSHCKNLSADQIRVDLQNRLHIDLSSFPAVTAAEPSKGCLIKIPYSLTEPNLAASLVLKGTYAQGTADHLTGVLRVGSAGQVGPASLLTLSESPQGKFDWQQPLVISRSELGEDTLKISMFLKAEVAKSPPSEPKSSESSALQFQPLELILDHVSTRQP